MMPAKRTHDITIAIRGWHLWAGGVVLVLSTGALVFVQSTVWAMTTIWLMLCLMVLTGLGVTLAAAFVYGLGTRLLARAASDNMNVELREKEHAILMSLESPTFEERMRGVVRR